LSQFQAPWRSLFFFSSRRQHTRFSRDWSSDVCSSDLLAHQVPLDISQFARLVDDGVRNGDLADIVKQTSHAGFPYLMPAHVHLQIGRASCRERGETSVVAELMNTS